MGRQWVTVERNTRAAPLSVEDQQRQDERMDTVMQEMDRRYRATLEARFPRADTEPDSGSNSFGPNPGHDLESESSESSDLGLWRARRDSNP